ncbi:DegT/DnrJ/EryC1/StrS family aminotransferase [Acaryochloris marina]|uniref:DegT/DnrJ/EryC1/StrS aminotransferase family protein n=1 Tax=Acaryochloris marina (strain MBIC 11017) TaxID=329726 RepID=B0C3B3_ACAM1|nr:DegT/DnrJ/EryC1/StrS family aminotransferase [Acaryochloris marina]ABW28612.1 DegT/DnrJ/EryC1/StrS aminotransferase family protein [Acaryochloris marina MBIC11017]BDM77611.1 aminotransferase [Acaryochloris marina MBIC10699]
MKIPILDLKPQYASIKTDIHTALDRVLESGAFIMGPEVKQFEQEVAAYLGVQHAIGVNSGTDALVIGLKASGIGPEDEVITTPFSFFATAESISNVGAKPIFVDIDPQTFNLNADHIEAQITPKTKAILPVHLYGHPAAMATIIKVAQKYNLKVIEDCAQAFGAHYRSDEDNNESANDPLKVGHLRDQAVGTIGDVGAFSFFPSKNLGAYGDGGLITTNDDAIAETAKMLRVHGALKKYHNEVLGYNSRLDAIQAAILRVKLQHIDGWNRGRRQVAQSYNDGLANLPGIVTPQVVKGHVFHQYTVRVLDGKRDALKQYLADHDIGSMIYYPVPQDQLPVYLGQYDTLEVSSQYTQEVLSLPIWPELQPDTQNIIIKTIQKFYFG